MQLENNNLLLSVSEIILQSRQRVYRMVNSVLLETYWQIGKLIVTASNEIILAKIGDDGLENVLQQLFLNEIEFNNE